MSTSFEYIVIGGGIAGASIAAHLAAHSTVLLLEMEEQPGYHSTGRSAALFSETYGNSAIRALTRASRSFFYSPPEGFCNTELVRSRSVLITARSGQEKQLEAFLESTAASDQVVWKSPDEAIALCPILEADGLEGALYTENPADIEVHELHQGYLRLMRRRNGVVRTDCAVTGLERRNGKWLVASRDQVFEGAVVVNAAGAWAGEVGKLAGTQDIGLQPLRRTVALIDAPADLTIDHWPMLLDVEEQFYLKPDAGKFLLSPADETLVPPSDVQPEDFDIAVAVDRLETATTLRVKRIAQRWAGLRSFVKDRTPVVGYDPDQPNFFWMAALGGYGIQTAPALSQMAAALVARTEVGDDVLSFGVDPNSFSPSRLSAKIAV